MKYKEECLYNHHTLYCRRCIDKYMIIDKSNCKRMGKGLTASSAWKDAWKQLEVK